MRVLPSLLAFASLLVVAATALAQDRIPWTHDLAHAQQLATQQQRVMLLHFWGEGCPPCRMLETRVFNRPEVIRALNIAYVPVKINVSEQPELARRYGVQRIPTDVFVGPDGSELLREISQQDPHKYQARLDQVAAHARLAMRPPADNFPAPEGSSVDVAASQALGYGAPNAALRPQEWSRQAAHGLRTGANDGPTSQQAPFADRHPGAPIIHGQTADAAHQPVAHPQVARQPGYGSPRTAGAVMPQANPYYQPQGAAPGVEMPATGHGAPRASLEMPNPALTTPTTTYESRMPNAMHGRPDRSGEMPNPMLGHSQSGRGTPEAGTPNAATSPPVHGGYSGLSYPQDVASQRTAAAEPPTPQPTAINSDLSSEFPVQGEWWMDSRTSAPPAAPYGAFAGGAENPPLAMNPASGVVSSGQGVGNSRPSRPDLPATATAPLENNRPVYGESIAPVVAPQVAVTAPAAESPLAMDGFCPVTLVHQSEWKKGDAKFGVVHKNRTYLFSSWSEQQLFLANPDKYAPGLSGHDPVILAEHGQWVEGKRNYGVFFGDQFFLFSDAATREEFERDPVLYAERIQQALQSGANGAVRR